MYTLFFCQFHTPAYSQTFSLKGKAPYRPDEILVRLKPGMLPAERTKTLSALGRARPLRDPDLFKIKLKAGQDVLQAVESLKNDPAVQWAQPNRIYYALGAPCVQPPTDQYYASPYNWPLSIVRAPQAWSYYSNFAVTTTGTVVV